MLAKIRGFNNATQEYLYLYIIVYMKLAQIALKNSRPINIIRIAFAILGVYILFSMPREQYPNVPLYYVHISVAYPSASAEEIEKEITKKIESAAKELQGINTINSFISDGLNFTRIIYSQSLSEETFKSYFLELKSIINTIDFPEKSLAPNVDNFTYLDYIPITNVVVYANDPDTSFDTLISTSNRVKTNLELDSHISKVGEKGLIDKKVLISLNTKKIKENNITLYEINQAIAQKNVSIPAGILETDDFVINVQSKPTLETISDLGSTIIRNIPEIIYLKDIADIRYFYDTNKEQIRYNDKNSVVLPIYKTEQSDSIDVATAIDTIIQTLAPNLPEGMSITTFSDTTIGVKNSISVLTSNAIVGFILLLASLLLFLGWKPALISAMEIPFTFATSFFILKLFNISLNTSTLFALVLVLGMVVDHGVVILENIIRLRHFHEYDRKTAVIEGLNQVGVPVIASTLTTIGTFLPLAFLPGLVGKFLLPVPITITVTLIISTISALVIIPIHYIEMPGNERTHELKLFEWGRRILDTILSTILKRKMLVSILSLGVGIFAVLSLFKLPVSLYDTEDQPFFFVDITLPIGSSMKESNAVINPLEEAILPLVENGTIKSVLTAIGNTELDPALGIRFDKPHNAQLQIELIDSDKYQTQNIDAIIQDIDTIIKTVQNNIASEDDAFIPYTYKIRKQRTGPPAMPDIEFKILGNNINNLEEIYTIIHDELSQYDEIYNINSNLTLDKPEIIITIDEKKAKQYGHSVESLGLLIRQWLSDDAVSSVFIDNKQNDIIVKLDTITDEQKKDFSFMTFPSRTSREIIAFDDIASFDIKQSLDTLYRVEGKRLVKISASITSRARTEEINNHIESIFNDEIIKKYPDVILKRGGEFDEFINLLDDILLLLFIGIFVVYVILVAEFRSYLQPLLIILTVLFTTIGVSLYLFVSKQTLSIIVLYSFVALVGVVVNGAIVLVSTANSIYRKDSIITHTNAIKQATLQRFKPILLTNFTTILGVLPTALGLNGKSPIWQPMAATIAVGLLFSTITTLIIIPAFYALLPSRKNLPINPKNPSVDF